VEVVVYTGPGKSMLAKRLGTILPPLTAAESLDTTRIYSAVGQLKPGESVLATRPFRSPHHTISDAGCTWRCRRCRSRS
jgi:magnesium chelatase family protein